MNLEQMKRIIEGALMAADRPLTIDNLQRLFDENAELIPSTQDIKEILQILSADYQDRAVQLQEVASGYRFQVSQEIAPWIQKLWQERPPRYSRALLETLALILYRQPITRAEIEDIRGVSVSTPVIKTLLEREWVKVVGHKDLPGKPALYATTKQFLDDFNLKSLEELPSLTEIQDLDKLEKELHIQLTLEVPDIDQTELQVKDELEPITIENSAIEPQQAEEEVL